MIIHEVEQGTAEWFALRAGKPTASDFSKLMTSDGKPSKQADGYAITLAAELYAGKPVDAWQGNGYTDRGKELEPDAVALYEFTRDVQGYKVGFITDDDELWGCSPDYLIGGDGMLEVKCLKAENHVKAILYYRKHERCPPDYVQQTQGQLLIAEREWCDLVFYHPVLPPLVIRQEPNEDLFSALKKQRDYVLKERDRIFHELKEAA